MKLIFDYNLIGFDPMEFELIEEEVTFQKHCSQVAANWNRKSSTIIVKYKLLSYLLVRINQLQVWKI